jgi:hypothetical protein
MREGEAKTEANESTPKDLEDQKPRRKRLKWVDRFFKDDDVENPNKTALLAGLNRPIRYHACVRRYSA